MIYAFGYKDIGVNNIWKARLELKKGLREVSVPVRYFPSWLSH